MVCKPVIKTCFIFIALIFITKSTELYGQNASGRPKVGLVLSGGGAKGLAHIGVLKVLEEVGMPIDYVGGTSMGSIVAGLYAIGYSADDIEQLVLSEDWMYLLTDQIGRENLTVPEKLDYDKYLLSLAFDGWKLQIPSGLGAGQNVSLLLSRMAEPVADIDDFSELPRPFLCVAMDIVTGKEVVLQKGYLPDAIRASMAIPSVFTPVEYGDYYLVDGGLVNNFPVDHVKDMGADIIIGVNLGLKEYTKEDLENLAAVLEQSLFLQAKERNLQNRELCDILISPDVQSSNAASFSSMLDLISTGEEVAREKYDVLKHLADSIKQIGVVDSVASPVRNDSLLVEDVRFEGLENVSDRFVRAKLRLNVPANVAIDDIENAIDRAMGTQFFNRITYKTEKTQNDSVVLVFRVKEKTNDLLRLGFQYDNVYKVGLLLNITLRNKLGKGSKLSTDLHLGSYPKLGIEYRINSGWHKKDKPIFLKANDYGLSPDFGLAANLNYFELYQYNDSHDLVSNYTYEYIETKAFISTSIGNPFYVESGLSYEYSFIESIFASDEDPVRNRSANIYGRIIYDSQDDQVLPTRGAFLKVWSDISADFNISSGKAFDIYRFGINARKILPATSTVAFIPYLKVGVCLADSVSPLKSIIVGGHQIEHINNQFMYSFPGYRLMESYGKGFYSAGLNTRIKFFNKHFVTIEGAYGRQAETMYRLISDFHDSLWGMSFKYSYQTIIGPLVLGASKSNQAIPWIYSLTLGYWF